MIALTPCGPHHVVRVHLTAANTDGIEGLANVFCCVLFMCVWIKDSRSLLCMVVFVSLFQAYLVAQLISDVKWLKMNPSCYRVMLRVCQPYMVEGK